MRSFQRVLPEPIAFRKSISGILTALPVLVNENKLASGTNNSFAAKASRASMASKSCCTTSFGPGAAAGGNTVAGFCPANARDAVVMQRNSAKRPIAVSVTPAPADNHGLPCRRETQSSAADRAMRLARVQAKAGQQYVSRPHPCLPASGQRRSFHPSAQAC